MASRRRCKHMQTGSLHRLVLAAACAAALPAQAEMVALEAARVGVASAVERYASAVACPIGRIRPDDVLQLSPGKEGVVLPKYAVLWAGDMTCYGGSGSEQTQLTIATVNSGQFVVQPELSSPVIAFESPVRFVERVVSYSSRNLVLEGKEYGPGDPQSTPTVPVRFILRVDAKGNWRLVDKVFLHQPADEGAR